MKAKLVNEALKDILKPKSKKDINQILKNKDWSEKGIELFKEIIKKYPENHQLMPESYYDKLLFVIPNNIIGELIIGKGDSKNLITFNIIDLSNYQTKFMGHVDYIDDVISYIKKYLTTI